LKPDAWLPVVHGFADDEARGEPGAEELVAIGSRAVARGDVVGRFRVIEPGDRAADGIAPGLGLEGLPWVGSRVIGVAPQVLVREDEMPAPIGVIVAEPVAPVVA